MSRRIAAFYLLLITAAAAYSQQPTPTPKPKGTPDDEIIKVSSRLVVVPVSVTDASGNPVVGLTDKDFRISEEGRQQTVENFGTADRVPLDIALLFDVSASTDKMFQFELDTAAKFLRDVMKPDDRATVMTIGESPVLVQPRDTADKAIAAISRVSATKGYTAFYDTVGYAADYLRKNAPDGTRRVILVISDGEDTNSDAIAKAIQDGYRKLGAKLNTIDSKSLYELTVANRNAANQAERQRVLKLLQNADTVFYSINPAGSSFQLNKISVFGQENMQKFAGDTGGSAFLPKFHPIDTKDTYQNENNVRANAQTLDQIFKQLSSELRAQYLVQYYSDADFPVNKYVKVDVSVPTRPGVRVRAREGYYVKP
ncbi:MAG: VWA domain-containing protein [Acidobacteria bacterium]|nr:VWA domain-containing protein [Acidobacteriota bacterium]